jgi:hypothetical protein
MGLSPLPNHLAKGMTGPSHDRALSVFHSLLASPSLLIVPESGKKWKGKSGARGEGPGASTSFTELSPAQAPRHGDGGGNVTLTIAESRATVFRRVRACTHRSFEPEIGACKHAPYGLLPLVPSPQSLAPPNGRRIPAVTSGFFCRTVRQ